VSLLAPLAPLIVRLIRLPVPDIAVQILFGIAVGPQVLGWARIDEPVRVLSLVLSVPRTTLPWSPPGWWPIVSRSPAEPGSEP
jgi:hypothetical protein